MSTFIKVSIMLKLFMYITSFNLYILMEVSSIIL